MSTLDAWTTSNSAVFVALDLPTFALKAAIAGLQMLSTFWSGWHDDPEDQRLR